MSRGDNRFAGLSEADVAALTANLGALTRVARANNEMVQELARMVAADRGIKLTKPSQAEPHRRGRLRYRTITRHAPGDLTAEVVNEETGRIRRYHIVRTNDGSLDVEEV
jgi:hypothetical protein